jgi:amino acid adenylation domain-containing protein
MISRETLSRAEGQIAPASFTQQQVWILDQLMPEKHFNTLSITVHVKQALSTQTLAQGLDVLLERHQILRTTFRSQAQQSQLLQLVAPRLTMPLSVIDLRSLQAEEREAEAQRLASEEAQRPFDMSQGPLVRACLLQLSTEESLLLLSVHHSICDTWSLKLLLHELATLYEALASGQPSPLPEPPRPYTEFAQRQLAWLQEEEATADLTYWKRQLADCPDALKLPTSHQQSPVPTSQGSTRSVTLSRTLSENLRELGQREDMSLEIILLAALLCLLYRYTGQEDLVIGTVTAGYRPEGNETTLGLFENLLALRTSLTDNLPFHQLLERVRETIQEAQAHQKLPFEYLIKELYPTHSLDQNPLFQVILTVSPSVSLPLGWTLRQMECGTSHSNLSLEVEELADGLLVNFKYRHDLFDETTIARLTEHWQTLLEGIVTNPTQPIARLPLLTEQERHQLLVEWNTPQVDYFQDRCIHELFEAQAERTPESIAVVCEGEKLTYEKLNQQANQLACHLRKMGVHEEVSVGLCIEPSVKVIVGLLAILKAGGVYVPMDPTYPPERIAFMAQETKMAVLITEQHQLTKLGQPHLQMVCLDADWPTISQHPTTNLPHTVKGDHLAYIIFTSGSTGQPKGVLIEHQSIASHCGAMIEALQLSADDCCLQLNAFTFDASLEQILPPLLVGARLVLRGPDVWSPAEFLQQAKDHQFTVVTGPCGYWHEVISHWATLLPEHLSGLRLRRMGAGGDRLSPEAVQLWRQLPLPSLQLFNLYGPTEGTITTTLFDIPRHVESELAETNIPIGRPLPNRCVYLLDKLGQPVPQGVAGELHIGGNMLARGYLNDPELTKERLITDPFSQQPGARLYKTGDLARYLPTGLIEFVGRVDHQVKIRGFRIELGEIETVIALHPAVFQTVVLVREDTPGVKRLVAYVVPRPDQDTSQFATQLRSLLKERLPDYMIPAAIVLLETFPLNASGKVDRHALPAPDFTGQEHQENFVAPRTPLEEDVARTWTQVLGLKQISIHDDFFALGGDSLLGMQVLSRLQTLLDVTVPLRRFFETPTVAQLAEAISQLQTSQSDKLGLRKLTKEDYYLPTTGNDAPVSKHAVYAYPVSPTQEGLWFLQQLEPESVAYNISVILHVHKPLDIEILKRSLNALVQRHDALRTAFGMHEGKPVQLVASTLALDLPVLDLQHLPEHEREAEALKLASAEAQRPFDLAQAPLLRPLLIQLTAEESVLVLTIHHIIVDGWSMSVLLPELVSLYEAFASGQSSPLQDQPLQYTDFSVWQREQLQEGQFAKQLAYWKQQLAHASDVLELPTTHPRTAQISSKGATYFLTLPQTLTDQLKHLSRQQGATLYMTLVAAFQTLLHRYTGQEDLLIGTVAANRQAETKETVGFFINTLVLRGDLSGDPNFSALLARSREVVLAAQTNQELPFTSLIQAIRPERQSGHNPLFQVMMRFDTPFPDLPKGWELINAGNLTATAQFELSLEVQEVSEGLGCRFEYYTDLFDEAAIARLAGHWQTLLEGIVANPNQPLSTLPLLIEQERQQMLVEWNATQTAYPLEQCFHQLFEAQVGRTPEAVAVVCGDEQLSYQDLNARANQLAHWLRERGVGPDKLVALLADRGIPFLVSILAVFKAGGAYLPLDPYHPAARIRKVIELSRCSIVLATTAFAPTVASALEDVPSELCPEPLYYETILETSQNTENLPVCCRPRDLAYVIYTSGSTGQPKGAMVEQRGMVNHIYAKIDALALTNKDTVAQTASQCFDISVWQFLAVLLVGGRVQIFPDEVAHHPVQLLTQVEHHRVSILETVPSLLGAMLDADEIGATSRPKLAALRWLIPTGEALPVELCRRWLHTYPHIPLLNAYGPTECSDDVTHYPIYEVPDEMKSSIPIGKAIPNMRLYVLDRRMQPLPIGVNGELYVGGIGVGRGYLGDERRTREAFVRDPFSSEEGAQLYKTGDLVRYLPDGNIDFLGRLDFQVKLRGFRIELGEIEVVLSQHPAVRLVVVVVREDIPGDKRLVAYVELQKDQTTTAAELKNHVKKQVPAYMVPSAFVLLEKLPLTPNGKVDRRALPVPEQGRSVTEESYVPPSLPVEKQLVQIWEKLLGVQPIGIKDDFFELGGNSLLGVQLFDQIAQVFGKKLPLSTLFGGATIEHLAKALAGESTATLPAEIKTDERAGLVAVQTGGSKRPFFFLHGQWVNSALYSLELAHALGPDQPFYLLEPYKYQDLVPLPTFEEVAAAYIKALRAVQPEGPYLLGGWCNGAIWAYEIARQLHAQGQKIDLLVMMDPDVPAQHEQERRVITDLGNLLGLSTEQQADWFLGYRHVRRTFYYWRLSKFKHTRTTKENRSLFEPNPVPPKLSEFIPRRDVVRGWPNIYEWMLAGYRPRFYPGKVAFFWTEEEPHRREIWRRTMESQTQANNVEVYIIPGNHITSRTEYLPVFAERFRECLTKV